MVDDDWDEFNQEDLNEIMPTTVQKFRSFNRLKRLFQSIVLDMDKASKVGIPLDDVKDRFYFIWEAIHESHKNLQELLRKDVNISVNYNLS